MIILKAEDFITKSRSIAIIDVRSPGEFTEGHLPGAINIPLFDDNERAIVGTLYKNAGRQPAIEKGLEIVGPKMVGFVRQAKEIATSGKLLVHCWRGGMRSESMAWLFERVGIECYILEGGYKAYRNLLLEKISDIPHLIVMAGHTGSGKTEILMNLRELGEQTIDLEAYANHRGSVFGGIGQGLQPTTQQFQNNLFGEIFTLDKSRRVWIEGESQTIGRVFLPDPLWLRMNKTLNIELFVPRIDRINRLVNEYGNHPKELMEKAITTISKRLGEMRANEILQNYQHSDLAMVADKLLDYYDKTYQYSRDRNKKKYPVIALPNGNAVTNARIILDQIIHLENQKSPETSMERS
jgi:tRNA 2-selenouridine synthase